MSRLNNLESTEGQIVGTSICYGSGSSNDTYAAIIEYYDKINKQTYEFTTSHCSNPGPKVGNSIKVLYDPENPGEGYDASFVGLWLAPLAISLFALAFWVTCCIFACKARKMFLGPPEPSNNTIEQASPSESAQVYNNNLELPSYNNNTIEQPTSVPVYTADTVGTNPYTPSSTTYDNNQNSNQYSTSTTQTTTNNNTGTSLFDQMNVGLK